MKNDRRSFLKKSGILTAGLSLGTLSGSVSPESADLTVYSRKRKKSREFEKDAGMKFYSENCF